MYAGSSVNNFGQDEADLDMCLLLPSGADVSSEVYIYVYIYMYIYTPVSMV
jgi:hypothetical protein